jgi:transposase
LQTMELWPAYSPDLSIIENVWLRLKKNVRARKPQGKDKLERVILEEWDKSLFHLLVNCTN